MTREGYVFYRFIKLSPNIFIVDNIRFFTDQELDKKALQKIDSDPKLQRVGYIKLAITDKEEDYCPIHHQIRAIAEGIKICPDCVTGEELYKTFSQIIMKHIVEGEILQ